MQGDEGGRAEGGRASTPGWLGSLGGVVARIWFHVGVIAIAAA